MNQAYFGVSPDGSALETNKEATRMEGVADPEKAALTRWPLSKELPEIGSEAA